MYRVSGSDRYQDCEGTVDRRGSRVTRPWNGKGETLKLEAVPAKDPPQNSSRSHSSPALGAERAQDLGRASSSAERPNWLDVLSTAECAAMLQTERLGRVGVSIDALPVILPVFYQVHDSCVWFFTEPGTKLAAAANNAVLAFEVDHLDDDGGWSVLVIGRSSEVVDHAVIRRMQDAGLRAGAPGHRNHLICIPIQHLSGRSFTFVALTRANPGYL